MAGKNSPEWATICQRELRDKLSLNGKIKLEYVEVHALKVNPGIHVSMQLIKMQNEIIKNKIRSN